MQLIELQRALGKARMDTLEPLKPIQALDRHGFCYEITDVIWDAENQKFYLKVEFTE
jgi:hypothetical protein